MYLLVALLFIYRRQHINNIYSNIIMDNSFIEYVTLNRIGCSKYMYKEHISNNNDYTKLFINNKWLSLHFNHCASIFVIKNNSIISLSIGHNLHYTNNTTLHAEEAAFKKLPYYDKSKQLEINVLVLKITRNGQYRNSKPCIHCLRSMYNIAQKKNYKINKIYYSTNDNTIINNSLLNLIFTDDIHISSYYKNRNYDITKWYKWKNTLLKLNKI